MSHLLRTCAVLLLALASLSSSIAKSVLFIGNSFTKHNDLPAMVANLAEANGHEMDAQMAAIGGFSLAKHAKHPKTLEAVKSKNWDVVVLQGHSLETMFPKELKPFLAAGTALKPHLGDAEAVAYMTWAYEVESRLAKKMKQNIKKDNISPEALTKIFKSMQETIAAGYETLAEVTGGRVAPVGWAWEAVRAQHPELDLFTTKDEYHPTPLATYLNSIVFYKVLFGEMPKEMPENTPATVDQAVHKKLVAVVAKLEI